MLITPQREYLEAFIRQSTLAQCDALLEVLRAHVQNVEEAPRGSEGCGSDVLESEGHRFIEDVRDAIRNAIT